MVTPRFTFALTLLATLLGLASQSKAQSVELLDFHLPGCGPCHQMEPTVARLAAEGVAVRKVDGSREPQLTQRLGVENYPTFVVVSQGREVGRIVGATSYESLRALLSRVPVATVQPASRTFDAASGEDQSFAVGGDHGPGLPASATGPAGSRSATALPEASGQLLEASVRITVNDPTGRAFGTGTIIDSRQGEALVVTCAHLFRGDNGQLIDTTNRLSVELFQATPAGVQVSQRVTAQLVSHDFEADVALVAIRPEGEVRSTAVAPVAESITVGAAVRSVGCDLGADPTVRDSRIVTIDRYNGPPNIETTGAPVQGRSGGGLFNANGEIIGVCYAADEQADEGLYAGLASIHAQLDRLGLAAVYQPKSAAPVAVASNPVARPSAVATSQLTPVERDAGPVFRGQNAIGEPLSTAEEATLEEIVARGESAEVVILIRPEAGGSTEVMTIDTASPEFVAMLRRLKK